MVRATEGSNFGAARAAPSEAGVAANGAAPSATATAIARTRWVRIVAPPCSLHRLDRWICLRRRPALVVVATDDAALVHVEGAAAVGPVLVRHGDDLVAAAATGDRQLELVPEAPGVVVEV